MLELTQRIIAQRWSSMVYTKHREPKAMSDANSNAGERQTTQEMMTDGLLSAPSAYPIFDPSSPEGIIGGEALFISSLKCKNGVGRKHSTQAYILNLIENTVKLTVDLRNGKYKEGALREVIITYPKYRIALSIIFRDRVFQRSLNDNALYPAMVRTFIYFNFACQKGKGTDCALLCMKAMMHRAYLKYGSSNFYILSCDIEGYYDNMVHAVTDEMFKNALDPWTFSWVKRTLDRQYKGEKGYNPGSQMVQIAGISYLNGMDHYIKEVLRVKLYVRYMDDFHIIASSVEELMEIRSNVETYLQTIGLHLHPKKTAVHSAKEGFVFLGFWFHMADSGKVLMFRNPKRVKEVKRRLRRLTNKIIRGEICTPKDLDISYECVRACIAKGNSKKLMRAMDLHYLTLFWEIQYAHSKSIPLLEYKQSKMPQDKEYAVAA